MPLQWSRSWLSKPSGTCMDYLGLDYQSSCWSSLAKVHAGEPRKEGLEGAHSEGHLLSLLVLQLLVRSSTAESLVQRRVQAKGSQRGMRTCGHGGG